MWNNRRSTERKREIVDSTIASRTIKLMTQPEILKDGKKYLHLYGALGSVFFVVSFFLKKNAKCLGIQ